MAQKKLPRYSQAVLIGLQVRGFSLAAIQRAARTSAQHLLAVIDGRRQLSDAQVLRLESLSGQSGAQLATSVYEPDGGPLSDIAEVLAAARSGNFARRNSRKATVRRPLAAHR
jgi:hypothetical protein